MNYSSSAFGGTLSWVWIESDRVTGEGLSLEQHDAEIVPPDSLSLVAAEP